MKTPEDLHRKGVALLASRICVLGSDPCGGSEVVLWEDVRILERAGIPVRVYARASRDGAIVKTIPLWTNNSQLNTVEYLRAFLKNEPEALILAYNEPALAGVSPERTIARFDWPTPLPRYWNWPIWLNRFARGRYLFPSESERDTFLHEHARIPIGCTWVVPNAVDLSHFRPEPQRQVQSNQTCRIGFAGQWCDRKGLPRLLDSWPEVKSRFPQAELCLAGGPNLWRRDDEAPGTREVNARIKGMNSRGLLHVAGALPRVQMPAFWNAVDIAVVPSLTEPFGLVALEALACGVPVIASSVGGLKEIVVDGGCGVLVPPGDTPALVRALGTLISNEPLRLRLAQGARNRAENFSMERRSRELLSLLLQQEPKAA